MRSILVMSLSSAILFVFALPKRVMSHGYVNIESGEHTMADA